MLLFVLLTFCPALRQYQVLERQRPDGKVSLMPRAPLLGEVASSVSDDDGEVVWEGQPDLSLPQGFD